MRSVHQEGYPPEPDPSAGESKVESRRQGFPIDAYRLFHMALRGKWLLLLAAVLGCSGGVLSAKLLVGRTYEAFALMVFEGNIKVTSLLPHMDIRFAYNSTDDETPVLMYSLEGNDFTEGDLISYTGDGTLTEVETATHEGARIDTVVIEIVPHPGPGQQTTLMPGR